MDDPNKDIKYAQFDRHARIRDFLMLKQAKSDLKWKMKTQAKMIQNNDRRVNKDLNMSNNRNNNDNKNQNTARNQRNKARKKNRWHIPLNTPQIADSKLNSNKNNKENSNVTRSKEFVNNQTKKLKKSQKEIDNQLSQIDNELTELSNAKLDNKLSKDEKMTMSNVMKMTKHTSFGAKLPIGNSYLKGTLELAMNSMTSQVKHYLPQHKKEYFQRLIYKYGTDYKAMARDKKLNFFQYTTRRIKKDIEYSKDIFNFPQRNGINGQRKLL